MLSTPPSATAHAWVQEAVELSVFFYTLFFFSLSASRSTEIFSISSEMARKGEELASSSIPLEVEDRPVCILWSKQFIWTKKQCFWHKYEGRGHPGHNMRAADINLDPTSPRPVAKVISTVHPEDFQHWQLIPHSVEDKNSLKGNHHGALVICEQLYCKPFSWICKQGRNPPMLKPITILLSESILSWPCDI